MLKRKKCYNIIYYKLTTLVSLYKEMPKIQKIDENSCYWQRKSSYLLNNLRNFNAIFRKGTTYGNIKSHKKTGFHPLLRRYIFGKTTIGAQLPPVSCPYLTFWRSISYFQVSCYLKGIMHFITGVYHRKAPIAMYHRRTSVTESLS